MEKKLTVRIQDHLLEKAKRYARAHNTNLTNLIEAYLENIPHTDDVLDAAPIVQRLTGTVSEKVSPEDFRQHLDEKYGR
jgi:predicted DNA-binding protein